VKKKKHPKDMTTDEAIKHLFTAKGHKAIRNHIAKVDKVSSMKKA
jgi:hypothetical protein